MSDDTQDPFLNDPSAFERMIAETPHIHCPRCHMTSFNPYDIRERYCANCHRFHEGMKEATP
jgi:ribosomal protein L37E